MFMVERALPVLIFLLAAFGGASPVQAGEYGSYDPKRIFVSSGTAAGQGHSLDMAYLDRMLNDLGAHARNYPPRFDTPQDRERAVRDVKMLSGLLDILLEGPNPHPELLSRAGFLNGIGHNLDIAGSAQKSDAAFRKLLAAVPDDPRGNYMFGTFLAGAGKQKEALPYLEKALAVGVTDAAYGLGMVHLTLGDKGRALEYLQAYKKHNPNDGNVDTLIEAIRNGKVEVKKSPG